MNRIALIPAYEPEENIESIVDELCANDFDVIVVDDGSGPNYAEIFDRLRDYVAVLSYDVNRGKGYALRTGMKFIAENYSKGTVVTLDSDGQHLVKDAIRVCAEVEYGRTSLAIGSRLMSKDCPKKSRFGNGLTRWVYRTVTGVKVYDTQSGLRAFPVALIPRMLEIPGDRYEYEMNVLLQMAKDHRVMTEIPIETIYFDQKNSVSHFNAVSDSVKIYKEIFKFAGSSFASFLIDYGIYSLLLLLLGITGGRLVIANVGARAVSSVANFFLNKKLVFKSKGNLGLEAAKYFALVLFVLAINSLFLSALAYCGCNVFVAKIFVEIIMFVFNYLIQHFLIFKKKKEAKPCSENL